MLLRPARRRVYDTHRNNRTAVFAKFSAENSSLRTKADIASRRVVEDFRRSDNETASFAQLSEMPKLVPQPQPVPAWPARIYYKLGIRSRLEWADLSPLQPFLGTPILT